MRPMSLYESGDSCGKVSLESLCHEERDAVMTGDVSLNKLTELIVRGGWPRNIGLSTEQAATLPSEYLSAVIDDDVYRIDGVKRNSLTASSQIRPTSEKKSPNYSSATITSIPRF